MLGKIEGNRRKGLHRKRRSEGIIDAMDINLSKLQETVKDRDSWCPAVDGIAESD